MIELIIVIVIVGILAVMTVPNLKVWVSRMRLNAATQHLRSSIQNVRKMGLTNRVRYCVVLTGDSNSTNGSDKTYLIDIKVQEEEAPGSATWTTMTTPVELAGWTNDAVSQLHKGISLEDTSETTTFATVAGCSGLLFNNSGFLSNLVTDFAHLVAGGKYSRLTLRNKTQSYVEQRSLWIDRGGNIRVTAGPTVVPALGEP
jgi:type II secretory pathway pseudopilin PulG